MSKTICNYLTIGNTYAHIVNHQLQEELNMTARFPWISMIVTLLTMLYIGFATAYWTQPEDDVDFEECDDDCQQDAYLEQLVIDHEQEENDLSKEALGMIEDSAGELMITTQTQATNSSLNCYGPQDKNTFNQGSDAWEALNSGKNIEIHGTPRSYFISMIWNSKGWLYTHLGTRQPGDTMSDHDHIPAWKLSYHPSFTCP